MWERSRGMRIVKIIGFGAIGLFIGLGLLNIIESGYFQRWKKLSTPPHNVSEYFSTDKEKNSPSPVKITKPCDYLSPEFSILSNSPQNIVDCIQRSEIYPDGYGRFVFVLDNNGSVWEWAHVVTAYDSLSTGVCLPGSGLFIGVAIALLANRQNGRNNAHRMVPIE
jgi:hypothetical protein